MKTTIKLTGSNEVTLSAIDPMSGEAITWVFWTPSRGGYIREGADHTANDWQVCVGLGHRGNTLSADTGAGLLAVIRSEWRAYKRAAEKALAY